MHYVEEGVVINLIIHQIISLGRANVGPNASLFLKAHRKTAGSLLRTDNVRRQISEHILAPNGGYPVLHFIFFI